MKSFGHSLYTPLLYAIADEGKDWAQCILGFRYLNGSEGFDMNLPEGVRYMQMAAEKGFAPAQYKLGSMYDKGQGVPQDWEQSFHWYLQAANQGNAIAQFNVGNAYFIGGQGVNKDIDQAFIWLKKSADIGYYGAQYNVGKHVNVFMHPFDVC